MPRARWLVGRLRAWLGRRSRAPSGDPSLVVIAVAERITGQRRAKLRMEREILSATSTSVVSRYEVTQEGEPRRPSAAAPLHLVEKRSRKGREGRFYRGAARTGESYGASLAPRMHEVVRHRRASADGFRFTLVLEHLADLGLPDHSPNTADRLAEAMAAVSTLQWPRGRVPTARNDLPKALLDRYRAVHRALGADAFPLGTDPLAEIAAGWHRLSAIERLGLPLVANHNDIHPKNVASVLGPDGQRRFIFLDWEQHGLNYLGAELHHVVRNRQTDEAAAPFWAAVEVGYIARVTELHGVDPGTVRVASWSSALRRVLRRGARLSTIEDLDLVVMLYRQLDRVLPGVDEPRDESNGSALV